MAPQRKEAPSSGTARRTDVHEWNAGIGVPWVDLTTRVFAEPSTIQVEPLSATGAARFAVEVGSGIVNVSMTIAWPKHHAYHYPSAPAGTETVNFQVPFKCTPEGEPQELPPGNDFELPKPRRQVLANVMDTPMSVVLEGYYWKEHPDDPPKTWVPTKVMHEWMKQLNLLHIVVVPTITLAEDGRGLLTIEHKDPSVPAPSYTPGSTGARTARLPAVEIILDPIGMPPPITTPNGLLKRVYFEKGSSDLNRIVKEPSGPHWHQGGALEVFIKDMYTRWEVVAALEEKTVPLILKARASATYKGMSAAQLKGVDRPARNAREYNLDLSWKRLRAVVDRITQITRMSSVSNLGPPLAVGKGVIATAIGMSEAPKLGEEDPMERRCDISLEGPDLLKYIKEAFGRKVRLQR